MVAEKYKLITRNCSMFHFYTLRQRPKGSGFLAFTGGIEMEHWSKIGSNNEENSTETNNPRFPCSNKINSKQIQYTNFVTLQMQN